MNVYLLVSFHFCSSVFFMVSPIKAAMTTVNSIQHIRYLVFSINLKVDDFWCDFEIGNLQMSYFQSAHIWNWLLRKVSLNNFLIKFLKVHLILSLSVMTFLRYLPTIAMFPFGQEAFKDCCTFAERAIRVEPVVFGERASKTTFEIRSLCNSVAPRSDTLS